MTHATHVIATLVSGMLAKAATQEHSDPKAQANMVAAAFAIADLIEKRRSVELEGETAPSPRRPAPAARTGLDRLPEEREVEAM